jgi:predicted metal-binding protein
MIGLSINTTNLTLIDGFNLLNAITRAYKTRALAQGFTIEALNCVNDITNTFN